MILGNWVYVQKQSLALQSAAPWHAALGLSVLQSGAEPPGELGKCVCVCLVVAGEGWGGSSGSLIRKMPQDPVLMEAYGNGY